ncbi:hypothetical protein [Brucella sp. BO3]|nr:hypothetical protein [Brucella sp. BO3]
MREHRETRPQRCQCAWLTAIEKAFEKAGIEFLGETGVGMIVKD